MAGRQGRFSTRGVVAALIVSMVALIWGEAARQALVYARDYLDAEEAIQVNRTVDHLLRAGQNLAFERGRTSVALRMPAPFSDQNRAFIDARRAAAMDNLTQALEHAAGADQPALARLREAEGRLRALRLEVDAAAVVPRESRPADLADRWFATASATLEGISQAMSELSLEPARFSPEFHAYFRAKTLAFDLRNALGVESSRIATASTADGPATPHMLGELLRLRGEGMATWRALRREVTLTRDAVLEASAVQVGERFFRELRPLQDRIIDARLAGAPSPIPTQDYTNASVPALDTIAELMEAAAGQTEAAIAAHRARARHTMVQHGALAALAFVFGAAVIIIVSTRLLAPLARIQSQLRALARGDTTVAVPPAQRRDEIGEMQAAVAAFRDSVIARQQIADELVQQGERLATLINAIPDIVCFKDGDGRWLVVNDHGRRLFGLNDVDYVGKTNAELAAWNKSLGPHGASDGRAWDQQAPLRAEEVLVAADGTAYIFDVVKVPLFGADGSRKGLVVVGRDTTERRRIEAALARLSRQNELILEAAGEGIVGVDAEGNTVFANPAAAHMTGWDLSELLGQEHHRQIHHTRADGSANPHGDCPVTLTLRDGEHRHCADDVFWRKDGTSFAVEFTTDPIVEQGEVRGAVIVFRDIGDRKRTQEAIDNLLADLQRSNADLEQFAYAVSHDLQEPLRMVVSYLQILKRRYEGRLDQDADDFIEFAVDGAKRMSLLINALLEYARVGTRGKPAEPLNLDIPFRQACGNLSVAIEESSATITVAEPLPQVMGDDAQLTSLFQNLMVNAIKYARPDTPPVLRVKARPGAAGWWVVSVSDNGRGIPAADRERVFGVFQRLGARPDASGSGMGLAICKRIVERLGGRVWIEDGEDDGCRISFTLRAG